MDSVLGARIAAAVLALTGIAWVFWSPAGVILIATGIGLVLIARRDPLPDEVHLPGLVNDLSLKGPGHHVPTPGGVRLFIPADAKGPYLIPELQGAVQRDPPASVGLALDPTGLPWLTRWEAIDGLPKGQGPEEILHHLHRAVPRLGLGRNVKVAHSASAIQITMRLNDAAAARQAESSGWHLQGGCGAQSFACAIAALSMAAPVRTTSSRIDDDDTLTVEVVAGTTA